MTDTISPVHCGIFIIRAQRRHSCTRCADACVIDESAMYYCDEGEGEPSLVFVHGLACAHEDWRLQAEHFRASRRVVACDLRGHGMSVDFDSGFDIETLGGDVARLLDALTLERAVLVGHSMGCRVVLEAALRCPHRVAGVALVDGSRVGQRGDDGAGERARAKLEADGHESTFRALFASMVIDDRGGEFARAVADRALAIPAQVTASLFADMVRWDAQSVDRVLGALDVPTAVIQSTYLNAQRVRVPLSAGETTPWTELVRQTVPGAVIEIVPGVGHFTMLEAPATVNRCLERVLEAARDRTRT